MCFQTTRDIFFVAQFSLEIVSSHFVEKAQMDYTYCDYLHYSSYFSTRLSLRTSRKYINSKGIYLFNISTPISLSSIPSMTIVVNYQWNGHNPKNHSQSNQSARIIAIKVQISRKGARSLTHNYWANISPSHTGVRVRKNYASSRP